MRDIQGPIVEGRLSLPMTRPQTCEARCPTPIPTAP
jgi:hypothetical protein